MSESNASEAPRPDEPTLFSALVTPYRSLNGKGFLIVMGVISGLSFAGGVVFLLLGAWPVMPFLGLDVLLIYWAFRANYRAAAAYEEVTVTASELHVKKVSAKGRVAEWSLNPVWVRLERETHEEFGLLRLFLVSRDRKLAIAGFLGPAEKESFAKALGDAISEAKRGPTRNL
jgi:uncharacterized membrane protein